MNAKSVADRWAAVVESAGTEVSVTLLVHGMLVSGFLTSTTRSYEWEVRSVEICKEMGNGGQENTAEPLTAAEAQMIRERWEEEHRGTELLDFHPTEICLRNATVFAPPGPYSMAFLLVDTSKVDAFTLGRAIE